MGQQTRGDNFLELTPSHQSQMVVVAVSAHDDHSVRSARGYYRTRNSFIHSLYLIKVDDGGRSWRSPFSQHSAAYDARHSMTNVEFAVLSSSYSSSERY